DRWRALVRAHLPGVAPGEPAHPAPRRAPGPGGVPVRRHRPARRDARPDVPRVPAQAGLHRARDLLGRGVMSGRRLASTARAWGVALASLLALVGCGGHSSDSTGPSSGSSGSSASSDLGTNDPRKASAFGDSITFGVLEEKKRVIAKLTTQNNYPADLQNMLQGLDPTWRVVNRGAPGEIVEQGASRIVGVLN